MVIFYHVSISLPNVCIKSPKVGCNGVVIVENVVKVGSSRYCKVVG